MKITVFSAHPFEMSFLSAALSHHNAIFTEKELDNDSCSLAEGSRAVALFTSDKADGTVLEKLAACGVQYIALRSVGYDHVDLKKARGLNIKIANVPAYSPYAVAEHAVMLLLALNRKLIPSQKLIHEHDFRLDGLTGFDLHGKTTGIIGLGKIGECFARIMKGFGCNLLCYDPYANQALEKELGLKLTDLEELCKKSDVISIHCPLNASTEHLLNKNTFSIMKKGVHIINTARGPIVKTTDAIAALRSGVIGGLGMDVYEFEKGLFFHDHRKSPKTDKLFEELLAFKNVLITGHQAFLTETALQNIADTTAYNLNCFEKGIPSSNELST